MKNLVAFCLETQNIPLLKKLWRLQCFISPKYKNEIWTDENGNTFFHYAARHHDPLLFQFAKENPFDLKLLNKAGKAPLHIFIERSFFRRELTEEESNLNYFQSFYYRFLSFLSNYKLLPSYFENQLNERAQNISKGISIDYNEALLKELIYLGADINQFMEFPERKELGWGTTDFGAFSIKDIVGSPIELLVYLFWKFALYPTVHYREEDDSLACYKKYFHTLTSLGANINIIVQGNTKDANITDAMSSYPTRIVSIFFCKFIAHNKDYYAIHPIISDQNIDFLAVDDMGNSVLHTLFARISARHERISDEICEKIVLTIAQNPKLTSEALQKKNDFNMSPLELLRWGGEHLRKHLESFILHKDLQNILEVKEVSGDKKGRVKI